MPGPKKGSAASKGAALPRVPGYTKLPGKSERYSGPDGVISKRQYVTMQRERAYFDGKRVSQDRFAKINAMVARQVAHSKANLSLQEKRNLAFKAAAVGVKAPSRRRDMNKLFAILRSDLELDYGDEDIEFWWDEHTSGGSNDG